MSYPRTRIAQCLLAAALLGGAAHGAQRMVMGEYFTWLG
jgi:hypothetical protein